jgi:hypothetical protein
MDAARASEDDGAADAPGDVITTGYRRPGCPRVPAPRDGLITAYPR